MYARRACLMFPLCRRIVFLAAVLLLCVQSFAQDYFKQANELYDQGKFKEAVKVYRAAIREGQYEPFSWFNLGNALVQLGKNNLALVAYKRTVELMPNFTRAWTLQGDIYYLAGDCGLAITMYGRAVELGEDNDHIHYALGESYLKMRDFALAQRHFERALYLNPDRMDAWFGLAETYERLGDYEMAIKTLKKAMDETALAGADVHFTLSYYYSKLDSTKKSTVEMENGLLMDPENVQARRYLAQVYLKTAAPWMAVFTLQEGFRYKKDVDALHVDLGQIYFDQKRYDEALEEFMTAWKLGNSQGRVGAENVGNIWYNAGDEQHANAVYKRILEKN